MKPLLPTMRETKRYLVYELLSEQPLGNAQAEVVKHARQALGLFDSAKAGIVPVRYDEAVQAGVLRVAHTSVDKVKAALLLLTEVRGKPVIARVRTVSGMVGKARLPTTRSMM